MDIINESLNPAMLKINNKLCAHSFNDGLLFFLFQYCVINLFITAHEFICYGQSWTSYLSCACSGAHLTLRPEMLSCLHLKTHCV